MASETPSTTGRIRYFDIRTKILIGLARRSIKLAGSSLLADIVSEQGIDFAPGWAVKAAQQLHQEGLIMMSGSYSSSGLNSRVEITPKGIMSAEQTGDIFADQPLGGLIPAADRTVELDHNSKSYIDAVTAIEKVRDEVKASNEYGSDDPEDRDQQVAELSAGLEILRAIRVRLSAVKNVLVPPLTHLAQKFVDSAIGELAKQAVALVRALFGL